LIDAEVFSEIKTATGRLILTHFENQESFMRKAGLPQKQMQSHAADHNRIRDLLVQIDLVAMAKQKVTSREIFMLINQEMVNHIETHDAPLRDFVKSV